MRGVKQLVLSTLVIAGAAIATGTTLGADDTVTGTQELTRKVRRALERLPYYGVYDFLSFKVEPGVITLEGYAHRPSLKKEAETMIRHAAGVDVANKIEILPSSTFDDQIRWTTFQRIYTDEFADRYVSGGTRQVQYDLVTMLRFPDMEPFGTYPVHIIVKHRRMALIGVVITDIDKTQILFRARQVPHAIGVEDAIMVRP